MKDFKDSWLLVILYFIISIIAFIIIIKQSIDCYNCGGDFVRDIFWFKCL